MSTMLFNLHTCLGLPLAGKPDQPQRAMLEERHDRSGVPFTLYVDGQGCAHPIYSDIPDYSLHLDYIRDFNVRSDDVILLGYPKSGNHWLFEILTMITSHSDDYTDHSLGESIWDAIPLDNLDSLPSPRVLVSHLSSQYLPRQIEEKKTKLVLILRNPKDILVSFYEFVKTLQICAPYRGTFDDFFQLYLDGQFAHGRWIDHVKSYDSWLEQHADHPIHFVNYENMKKDPKEEIRRLCYFLGRHDVSEDYLDTVVDKTQFENMSRALNAGKLANMKLVFEKGAPGIFRKGIVGDWKHRFSESQNEEFDRHLRTCAEGSKLASLVDMDFALRDGKRVTGRISQ